MTNGGQWMRSGEGWSLQIGTAFCGSVTLQNRDHNDLVWVASINSAYLGEYPNRDRAMARVEKKLHDAVEMVLDDWNSFKAVKAIDA